MVAIVNKYAKSVASLAASYDGVPEEKYIGVLLRYFFIADDKKLYTTVEWGVKDRSTGEWVATFPIPACFKKRASKPKKDIEIVPTYTPFPLNLTQIPKSHPCYKNMDLKNVPYDENTEWGVYTGEYSVEKVDDIHPVVARKIEKLAKPHLKEGVRYEGHKSWSELQIEQEVVAKIYKAICDEFIIWRRKSDVEKVLSPDDLSRFVKQGLINKIPK